MKLKGKKVLVTGAGGFVGSHLVEALLKSDYQVKAFVHYNSRNDWGWLEDLNQNDLKNIQVITGDLRDGDAVRKSVKGQDLVFHLGALIGIPYSYVNPADVVETNVKGTLNILLAGLDYRIEKIIHTSTSEVYGTAQYIPIDEAHPINPQSPYAASKASADYLALSFNLSYDLPIAIIRPFNIYGPRQSARSIIPNIIIQAMSGNLVKIGSPYPTRDFTFVSDAVEGFIRLAECDEAGGGVVNLGFGNEVSVKELVKLVSRQIGEKLVIKKEKERIRPKKSEVERLICDSTKAKRLFAWNPKIGIDEGIGETIDWFKRHLNKYKARVYNI